MICFYHSKDLDGHCSGAIVRYFRPSIEMIPFNYADNFPWDQVAKHDEIYMVDLSLPPDEMEKLFRLKKNGLIWIDHHETAINDCPSEIKGLRRIGDAACELTWEYLSMASGTPFAVWLLGRYDVWDHENKDVIPFQYGLKRHNTDPSKEMGLWKELLSGGDEKTKELIKEGAIIKGYVDGFYKRVCKNAFEINFDGYRAIVVNTQETSTYTFDSVYDKTKHDLMIGFFTDGKYWHCSLRSNKINVGQLAKSHGGGGHREAAGFSCQKLPWMI